MKQTDEAFVRRVMDQLQRVRELDEQARNATNRALIQRRTADDLHAEAADARQRLMRMLDERAAGRKLSRASLIDSKGDR